MQLLKDMLYRFVNSHRVMLDIAEVVGVNGGAITIALSAVEWTLKIGSLSLAIAYTSWKWRSEIMEKRKNKKTDKSK